MPVPSVVTDLTSVAASNSPPGGEAVFPDLDGYLRAHASFIKQNYDNKANLSAPAFTGTASFSAVAIANTATYSATLLNTGNAMPMFRAYRSTDQTSGTTAVFGTEATDQGGVYNNTTGVFTAPVAGVYALKANVLLQNNTSVAVTQELLMNGSTAGVLDRHMATLSGVQNLQFQLGCVCRLAASETVTITATQEAFSTTRTRIYGLWATGAAMFSGALLY